MDIYHREPPATQDELLYYQVMYKTNRDIIWPIIFRWCKKYPYADKGLMVELMTYIRNN